MVLQLADCHLFPFYSFFFFFRSLKKSQHHILLSEQHRAAVNLVPALVTCRVCPQSLNIDQFPRNASDVYTLCLFFLFQTKWNSDLVGVPLDGVHGACLEPPFFFSSQLTIRSSCRNCRTHSLGKEKDPQGILGTYTQFPSTFFTYTKPSREKR